MQMPTGPPGRRRLPAKAHRGIEFGKQLSSTKKLAPAGSASTQEVDRVTEDRTPPKRYLMQGGRRSKPHRAPRPGALHEHRVLLRAPPCGSRSRSLGRLPSRAAPAPTTHLKAVLGLGEFGPIPPIMPDSSDRDRNFLRLAHCFADSAPSAVLSLSPTDFGLLGMLLRARGDMHGFTNSRLHLHPLLCLGALLKRLAHTPAAFTCPPASSSSTAAASDTSPTCLGHWSYSMAMQATRQQFPQLLWFHCPCPSSLAPFHVCSV